MPISDSYCAEQSKVLPTAKEIVNLFIINDNFGSFTCEKGRNNGPGEDRQVAVFILVPAQGKLQNI